MKKILLLFALITFCFSIQAQNENTWSDSSTGTTLEEYNYLTKGYKIQVESGLDMKKGYTFDRISKILKGNYSFDYSVLVREVNKEAAAIFVKAYSGVSGKTYYLCIPIRNDTLTKYFDNTVSSWDESMTTAFANSTSELFSQFVYNVQLEFKNKK